MRLALLALAAWVLVGLLVRPPLPLDETRYLAVAWEMHQSDAWLIPTLDGTPYHHKPPLLFWLTRVGWELFGVHGWWPRLIPALAAGLGIWMTMRLAARLHREAAAALPAGLLLAGCVAWPLYASVLLFDLLVACCALLGWHALLDRGERPVRAALLLGLAVGGGVLCKGPVILVYLLPPMFCLADATRARSLISSAAGLVLGVGLALAWALPAAEAGGEAYREALLFGQTAGRLRESFSHARPFWWYLPILLVLLLPWSLWPRWWQALRRPAATARRPLLAVLLSFLVFVAISGKQPHYLVPLLPPTCAALAAHFTRLGRRARLVPAWTCAALSLILVGAWEAKGASFDLRPAAAEVVRLQDAGHPIAILGDSHGQFSFLGRLEAKPRRVGPGSARLWASRHPEAQVILIEGAARRGQLWTEPVLSQASLRQPYRAEELAIVPARTLIEPPSFDAAIEAADEIILQAIADGAGPGVSVAVGHAGKIAWAQGYGMADVDQDKLVSEDTLFRIGSVSKSLTAVGLMKLVQEGKLDLDADVRELVPEFPEKRWPVTVRQLAGHLGGIRHYRGAEFLSRAHYPTVRDGLSIFAADPLLHEPGTEYAYSSYGWNLLSAAMESAAEQPFLKFMQKEVFDPLGLRATMPDHAEAELPRRTSFYQVVAGKTIPAVPVDNSYKWAGGGYLSTPSDLVRFGFGVLQDKLLRSETRAEMWKPMKRRDGRGTGYGIGWRSRQHERYGRGVGHSGGSVGGVTMLEIYPQHQLVVAVTINNSEGPATALARRTAAPFLEAVLAAKQAPTDD